jgi:myo-inositol-1(or 4)-monophosphatase
LPVSDRAALLEPLAAIARDAGDIAVAASQGPLKRWNKGKDHSPVSEADLAVNDFLTTRLPPLAPDAGWLSEETEDNTARTSAPAVWVVDPIDGTRAFLENKPDWTVSIALVEHGRPIIAALYAPVLGEMYLAARGHGATRNGALLKASDGATLDDIRLAGPKSTLTRLTGEHPRLLPQPKVHSLALRITRVASGELDVAMASRNSHDWDLAAADLLVHEAGGALTDFNGHTLQYNRAEPIHGSLIAAGRTRHGAMLELVRDRRNEFA